MAILLLSASMGCGDTSEPDVPVAECRCDAEGCPEGVCDIAIELPTSCSDLFESAAVTIDGQEAGRAQGGVRYSSCDRVLSEGESAAVQLRSDDGVFETSEAVASCQTGGASVTPAFCTLRFDLAQSCVGSIDEALVVIDGVEVGQTRVDAPFVPCRLLVEGESVTGTIRAGTAVVLSAPLECLTRGTQPRLIMECP